MGHVEGGGRFVSSFNFSNECVARRHLVPLQCLSRRRQFAQCNLPLGPGSPSLQIIPLLLRRFLLLAAASSSHLELASNNVFHSPLANTSNLSRSFSFGINPPPWRQVQQHPWDQKGRASTLCLGEQRHHSTLLPKHTGRAS